MIVFVCEHGAAKSIIAATYFNQVAREKGLNLIAVARGTNPALVLSSQAVEGLAKDGLVSTESLPQKLTDSDIQSAQRVIPFCDLPSQYDKHATIEYWMDVPPVSENYGQARGVIVERIHRLLSQLQSAA